MGYSCVLQDMFFTFKYVFVCGVWDLSTLSPFISLCFFSLLLPVYFLPNLSCFWQSLQVILKSVDFYASQLLGKSSLKIPYNFFFFVLSFCVCLISRRKRKSSIISIIMDNECSLTMVKLLDYCLPAKVRVKIQNQV